MRLTTNDKLIERQSKIARYATFGGFAILIGSLFTTIWGNYDILIAYALLFVGFGLAYVGANLANKYIKEPRADTALTRALKGFDNKFHLYNYLLPSNHVLLTPTGLIVFRVKSNSGKIRCAGDKWSGTFRLSSLIGGMGQEAIGNPTLDVRRDIAAMKSFLADKIENAGLIPIDGYVVFTNPTADVTLENCSVPVVRVEDLKDTLRKEKRGPVLTPQMSQDLARALDDQANAKAA